MNTRKGSTVYFEPDFYDALRRRAAAGDCSISDLVNEAVREFLAKDLADLSAVTEQLDTVYGAPGAEIG